MSSAARLRLAPYAKNARTHSAEQVAQIASSIREWGWTVPVLIDEEGGLIAGHGRVLAAKSLGLAEVPVMVARGLIFVAGLGAYHGIYSVLMELPS